MNARKAGNVYVQWVTEKLVLFVLSWEPQQYPSEPGMTLRRGDQASLSLSMFSVGGCHMGKSFVVNWVWEKLNFKRKKINKFLCCVISGGFQYGDVYYKSQTVHLPMDSSMVEHFQGTHLLSYVNVMFSLLVLQKHVFNHLKHGGSNMPNQPLCHFALSSLSIPRLWWLVYVPTCLSDHIHLSNPMLI